MKISFAATNPCHLFPFAKELHASGNLHTYYSGYPRWKLKPPPEMDVRAFPLRTLITYGLLRLPHALRPRNRSLFRWQDKHFDHQTSRALTECDAIHGIPGQCEEIFTRARELGVTTVLNHATGPTQNLAKLVRPEFERVGLEFDTETAYDANYLAREQSEYALADYHCVASSVVRRQLVEGSKISPEKIWVVPYAADESIFHPPSIQQTRGGDQFRIVFAGQLSLRKGIRFLLDALSEIDDPSFEVHFYGASSPEVSGDLSAYKAQPKLHFHGPVSQSALAEAFRNAEVLVLPSIEEGFGLVVPQALNCGLPCIVSDSVGAADLIRQRENGSVFRSANSSDLASELLYWKQYPQDFNETHSWPEASKTLTAFHQTNLK